MGRAAKLLEMYQAMQRVFGASGWWPAESPLEVMVGAVLTQNTAWANVDKALARLKAANQLDFRALRALSEEALAELIRPAGFYRVKAARLKALLAWLDAACGGELGQLADTPSAALREQLLAVKGIGPETADAILLYALGRPAFVVDEYTRRILSRHGLVEPEIGYEDLRAVFTDNLPADREMYGEYHAYLVEVGKNWCKRQKPACAACPLLPFLDQDFYE